MGGNLTDDLLKGAQLLIVDDEALVRDFLVEALTRREIVTTTAEDGSEAVKHLENNIERISEKAMNYLTSAPWQGNVRELENSVERAVIMCRNKQIELTDFFLTEPTPEISQPVTININDQLQGDLLTIADLEKRHILQALKVNEGHRAKTAEILGISIRTLRNKLNEYRQAGVQI